MKYGDKEVKIERTRNGHAFEIKFTTGGEIPGELKEQYASIRDAEMAVITYVANVKGEKKRGTSQRD